LRREKETVRTAVGKRESISYISIKQSLGKPLVSHIWGSLWKTGHAKLNFGDIFVVVFNVITFKMVPFLKDTTDFKVNKRERWS